MKQTDVEVLINSKPVKQFVHEGNLWVEARKGANYEVRVRNSTWGRVLVIASVDGLSVLDGKPATADSAGYVLRANSAYTIKGFRTSDDSVNLFQFSPKSESYAVQSPTGEQSSQNCGIIAVRLIEEKEKPRPIINKAFVSYPVPRNPWRNPWREPQWPGSDPNPYPFEPAPYWRVTAGDESSIQSLTLNDVGTEQERGPTSYQTRSRAGGCSAGGGTQMGNLRAVNFSSVVEPKSFDMGTKFSDTSVTDKVETTIFERGDVIKEVNLYYASRKAMERMGIEFDPVPAVALPQGFKDGYCQKPRR